MTFQSPNVFPFVTATVNSVINANYRLLLKSIEEQLEKHTRGVALEFLKSIFKAVPIQDFYQKTIFSKQASPKM